MPHQGVQRNNSQSSATGLPAPLDQAPHQECSACNARAGAVTRAGAGAGVGAGAGAEDLDAQSADPLRPALSNVVLEQFQFRDSCVTCTVWKQCILACRDALAARGIDITAAEVEDGDYLGVTGRGRRRGDGDHLYGFRLYKDASKTPPGSAMREERGRIFKWAKFEMICGIADS
jgi:hypothetical protein